MNSEKNMGRIVGILFIGTTIVGMLSVVFFGSNLQSPVDLAKIASLNAKTDTERGVV